MPDHAQDESTATHYALFDDTVDIVVNGVPKPHAVFDCITCSSLEKLSGKTWRHPEKLREGFSGTMVLYVPLDELRSVKPSFAKKGRWLSFHLQRLENADAVGQANAVTGSYISLSGSNEPAPPLSFMLTGITLQACPIPELAQLIGLQALKRQILDVLWAASPPPTVTSHNVVVYDIGQGSATALVDDIGRPVIFFDLGWPTSANAGTRPTDPPALFSPEQCLACNRSAYRAPIILSHWDFDHWAYAIENETYDYQCDAARITFKPEAINRPWILPRPPRIGNTTGLGPTHMRLLTELPFRLLWPTRLRSVSFWGGTLTRTDPRVKPHDRNEQGLAWFVGDPGSTAAVLLPGDASYSRIRFPQGGADITNLLASHHGGRVTGIKTHLPSLQSRQKLVISVGSGNAHRHPSCTILRRYSRAGWRACLLTQTRLAAPGSTAHSGSALLQLDPLQKPTFNCACLRSGNLVPTQ
ncbi:hypothetical protein ACIQSO_11310 [Pseudomonas putida]|uniref:hypothetical protein n=1 Tax=Pseudomonas putida TaxID=303 RepID=UPI00383B64D1